MSFGEGNLRNQLAQCKRTLGGTQAALNRARQRERELESLVLDMHKELSSVGGAFLMGYIEKRMVELGIEVER